jgi:exodeoxyribonuclease VII large subunit
MPDLFDLPFEDEPAPEPEPESRPAPAPATVAPRSVKPEPPPAPPAPPKSVRRVLTVSELNAAMRDLLEQTFIDIWVEGEISNCRLWNTGHLYFTLKDQGAQLKAVMFRTALRYLRFKPEDGQHVLARGRISVYEPKGEYQIICELLEPKGLGQLQLAFEQLKKRLQAEGLFASERKRPLPLLPRKIGVVTSLDGAAVRDIIKVLRGRYANSHIVVRPTRVQGDGAAAEIARGLKQIGQVPGVDVIIVGRGGGSLEDLWAFNEEIVARAIAASPVPVISAVGHEVDVTIADFVADLRAATPSNAAELVVARKDQFGQRLDHMEHRLVALLRHRLQQRRSLVHLLANRRGLAGVRTRVGLHGRHTAELTHALRQAAGARLQRERRTLHDLRIRLEAVDQRRRLAALRARLVAADAQMHTRVQTARHRADRALRTLAGRLENLSPLAVLSRGYAICWNADRTAIIRDAAQVEPGDTVQVGLARGALDCTVTGRRAASTKN